MLHLRARSLHDTRAIAAAVARASRPGDLIVLAGEMGAGKTAFAQGFAAAWGVEEPVTSPTYTLVHTYSPGAAGRGSPLHHADLYRLEHTTEVSDLSIDELLDTGPVLVEWGDAVDLGARVQITLERPDPADAPDDDDENDDEQRLIELECDDPRWQQRWPALVDALRMWAA